MGIPSLLLFKQPQEKAVGSGTSSVIPLTFLFDDQFVTEDLAPLGIPRACEPGPGIWNSIVDVGNRLSISGSSLTSMSGGNSTNTLIYSSTTINRSIGVALMMRALNVNFGSNLGAGFRSSTDSLIANIVTVPAGNTTIRNYNTNASNLYEVHVPTMLGSDITTYTILRSSGVWHVYRQSGNYYLTMVASTGSGTAFPVQFNSLTNANVAEIRVAQLDSPWTNNDNLLTYRVATVLGAASGTSEADAIHVVSWTPSSGETLNLIYRLTDDNNYWTTRVDETGNTIKIIEVSGGVETERASSAVTINAGTSYRITTRAKTQQINGSVNGSTNLQYASASAHQTSTGTKITINGSGTLANWEAWQVNIVGSSATELARMDT